MRKRTSGIRDDDSDNDESDPEESAIQAVHPSDKKDLFFSKPKHDDDASSGSIHKLVSQFKDGQVWWAQYLTIVITATLTYSYNNAGNDRQNVQIAIMTVITLVGASPFCSTHLITASIGAFVGGQNIIGSTGEQAFQDNTELVPVNYLWLLLLSLVVGSCFRFFICRYRILDGFAGRLGTTTFLGMNLTMLIVYGPVGVVDWDRYILGLTHFIHLAEEDSTLDTQLADAWTWTEEAELAIGYILAVVGLGVVAGGTRVLHHEYVQQWHSNTENASTSSSSLPPTPLNNVLIPELWALLGMLVVNATEFKHASGLYNGFAVGSYVAMASLQRIPSILQFATVSLVAAAWGLALTPFFVGFAGKSGFTSMLGHVTHNAMKLILGRLLAAFRRQEQKERQERLERQESLEQEQPLAQDSFSTTNAPAPPQVHSLVGAGKYVKPKESLYTKQQRRQEQRLRHSEKQKENPLQSQQEAASPILHHRAWSALPTTTNGMWQHPLIEPNDNTVDHPEAHNVV